MTTMQKYFFGFRSFWLSFSLVKNKKGLKKFLYIPVGISMLFFLISLYIVFSPLPNYLFGFLSIESEILNWILSILFYIFSFLFVILGTYIMANIVSMPFNAMMCEYYWKTEFQWKANKHSTLKMIKLIVYFLLVGLIKAAILGLIAVLCFALSFFPALSLFVAFIGLLMITFDCCDISFELLEKGLGDRFRFFKKHFIEFSGFATAMSIVALIPGFNFFFLPFMVLGASHMVYQLDRGET